MRTPSQRLAFRLMQLVEGFEILVQIAGLQIVVLVAHTRTATDTVELRITRVSSSHKPS